MKNLMKYFTVLGFSLLITVSLVACADNSNSHQGGSRLMANQNGYGGSSKSGSAFQRFSNALANPSGTRRSLGTDEFLADAGRRRELISVSEDGAYTLNLVNVPIERAAEAVLGDALKKNYTIQPGVSGTVTLQTTRALSERALLDTFQTILELNGAALEVSGGLIKIVAKGSGVQRISRIEDTLGVGARVVAVPLQYIGTAEMMRLLEPMVGQNVRLQPIPKRNILLIAGGRDEINATIDAVNLFDVDVLKGKSVGLFKLNAAEPEAIVEELSVVFENQDGGSLQNVVTFVPSKRLGAVIVITSRQKYLAEAERWIRDLDRTARGVRRRPAVYALQNRSAEELAPILNEMLQEVAQEEGDQVEGTPKVVADNAKNSLVVWGNDNEQNSFSRLIQSLDTTPVQVLLEATIAEVRLNDELDFGLRWFFEGGNGSATFSDNQAGSIGANFPGFSFLFQGASAAVTLNALSSVTDVEVVSSPSLMVLDNQEARLQIGDEVPIATQQVRDTSDPNSPVVNTISFRDTGIILTVRPRVSNSGQITLDIEQEVSSVSNTTSSGIDSPTISQRRIKTSVVATDGQTIALGGLIEESRNRRNTKVPLAGDAPVLGALFRSRRDKVDKTELLVLITPRIIRDGSSSLQITQEIRDRIAGANGLIQSGIVVPNGGHRIID